MNGLWERETAMWHAMLPLIAAAITLGLGGLVLARNRGSAFHRSVAAVLGFTGLINGGAGLALLDDGHAALWQTMAMLGELFQPAALVYAGLALMGSTESGTEQSMRRRARAVAWLALILGILVCWRTATQSSNSPSTQWIPPEILGHLVYIFIIVSSVVGIAQFELLLRAMHDPVRYRFKFILVGLGSLAGYQTYHASRVLVGPVVETNDALTGGLVTLISVTLLVYGFRRIRLRALAASVYVSQRVLYGSVTFIVVGLYLVAVGVLGEIIRYSGRSLGLALGTAAVFAACVALVVVLFSRAARAKLSRWITRSIYWAKYDYRAKWLEMTDAFRSCETVESVLDAFMDLLSRTFGAPRISVWMQYDADGAFHMVRSANVEPSPHPLSPTHPIVEGLMAGQEPIEVENGIRHVLPPGDPFLEVSQAALCVPIRSGEGLIAFIALSHELGGEPYGTDDRGLLRAMAHHVGMLLSLVRMSEERRAAAELEALHRFSAFCLHDLKNLTAGLSLVAQNADVYGHDPAFQESAMRTVTGTVRKMMGLMAKLSLKAGQDESSDLSARLAQTGLVDVQEVIGETVASLNGGSRFVIRKMEEPVPPVRIGREPFQQIVLNVLLNAQQAGGEHGEIRITTERADRVVAVTVEDSGCGIAPDRLRSLFQPFRSTKRGGVGIGLYECKRILEAHQGSIRVHSEPGRGTRVRIELPIPTQNGGPLPSLTEVGRSCAP